MAIKYVRTTGDDTTGDGTTGNPWKTISKAFATVSAGDVVKIGTGTYAENTGGLNYLSIQNKNYASETIYESESGIATDVVITGNSHATYNTLIGGTTSNLTFRNVTFSPSLATTVSALRMTASSGVRFEGCRFLIPSNAGAARLGLQAETAGAVTIANMVVQDCVALHSGAAHANGTGFNVVAPAGASVTGAVIRNCVSELTLGRGLYINGNVTTFSVIGGRFAGGAYGAQVGNDSNLSIGTATGTVTGITSRAVTGHAFLVGCGADGVEVFGNFFEGGDYGAVIKENANVVFRGNYARGGTSGLNAAALYLKAATGTLVTLNRLVSTSGTAGAVKMGVGDTGNKCGTITLTDNEIQAVGIGLYQWGGDEGDTGGCIVDRNVYELTAGGTFGTVRGTGVTTLAALLAVWAAYGAGTNDLFSKMKMAGNLATYRRRR